MHLTIMAKQPRTERLKRNDNSTHPTLPSLGHHPKLGSDSLGGACVGGLYVQAKDMSNRCNHCNSLLQMSRPPLEDRDGVCRCTGCGRVFLIDNEDPAELPCCDRTPISYVPEPMPAAWLN